MFASKEVAEERQAKAAEQWRLAKRTLNRWTLGGCVIPLMIVALLMAYLTGYVAAAVRQACISPEVTSTR